MADASENVYLRVGKLPLLLPSCTAELPRLQIELQVAGGQFGEWVGSWFPGSLSSFRRMNTIDGEYLRAPLRRDTCNRFRRRRAAPQDRAHHTTIAFLESDHSGAPGRYGSYGHGGGSAGARVA